MRLLFFLFILTYASACLFAQRQIVSQDVYLNKQFTDEHLKSTGQVLNPDVNKYITYESTRKLGAHGFYNEKSGNTALFLIDFNSVNAFLYDKDFALTDHRIYPREKSKAVRILGVSSNEKDYILYLSDNGTRKFKTMKVNFEQDIIHEAPLNMVFNKEKYVQSFSYNNVYHMITIGTYSSVLWLYSFDNGSIKEVHKYDFSEHRFSDNLYEKMFQVLEISDGAGKLQYPFEKMDHNIPNSLKIASKESKMYINGNKLILTLDNVVNKTNVITIDLVSFESTLKEYPQIATGCSNKYLVGSNSFVHNNHIIQVSSCESSIHLTITDMETGTILKSYSADKDEEIPFKNGDLYKEVQKPDGHIWDKEITSTKYFLQLLHRRRIGVSVYEKDSTLELQIGKTHGAANSKVIRGGGSGGKATSASEGMYTGILPTFSAIPRPHYAYNPVMIGYGAFVTRRSIFFNTILDSQTYEHKTGQLVVKNVFDRMKLDTEEIHRSTDFITVFKTDELFIFGYYSKRDEKYLMFGYKEFE